MIYSPKPFNSFSQTAPHKMQIHAAPQYPLFTTQKWTSLRPTVHADSLQTRVTTLNHHRRCTRFLPSIKPSISNPWPILRCSHNDQEYDKVELFVLLSIQMGVPILLAMTNIILRVNTRVNLNIWIHTWELVLH